FYPRGVSPVRPVVAPPLAPPVAPPIPAPPIPSPRIRAPPIPLSAPPPTPKRRALVVFVGRAVPRSARTTCWPFVRPDVIWVVSVPAYPVPPRVRVGAT